MLEQVTAPVLGDKGDGSWSNISSSAYEPGIKASKDDPLAPCKADVKLDLVITGQNDKPEPLKAGDHSMHFISEGRARQYDVHVPKDYDGSKPLPVMYILHGVTGYKDNVGLMRKESDMDKVADEKNMIVVYAYSDEGAMPLTLGKMKVNSWNSPGAGLTETRQGYDDVNYMKDVVSRLPKELNVDKGKQYIVGFSEGAEFAQHIAGRMPGVFAGVGSVHGSLLGTEKLPAKGDQTAVMIIGGDADHMLPWDGGRGLMTLHMPKVADSKPQAQESAWTQIDSCTGNPKVTETKSERQTLYTAEQCNGAAIKVSFQKEDHIFGTGGKHAWDGPGEGGWPLVGDKNKKYDTSRELADFLLKFRKDDGHLTIQRRLEN